MRAKAFRLRTGALSPPAACLNRGQALLSFMLLKGDGMSVVQSVVRQGFAAATLLVASMSVQAADSCEIQVVKLLAAGNAAKLAEMFSAKTELEPKLKQMIAQLGALSEIQQTDKARFTHHSRVSIGKSAEKYSGAWVNAQSQKLGAVQFHLEMPFSSALPSSGQSSSACQLLALNLDFAS